MLTPEEIDEIYNRVNNIDQITPSGTYYTEADRKRLYPTQEEIDAEPGVLERGIKGGGGYGNASLFAGAAGLAAKIVGAEDAAQGFYDKSQDLAREGQELYPQKVNFDQMLDDPSLSNIGEWLGYNVAAAVPMMVASMGVGGLAGLTGRAALGTMAKKAGEEAVKKATASELAAIGAEKIAESAASDFLKTNAARIGTGAAAASMAPVEAGGLWIDDAQKHGVENTSPIQDALFGAGSAGLETLGVEASMLGRLLGKTAEPVLKETADTVLGRLGQRGMSAIKEGGKQFINEGVLEEAGQEGIAMVNEALNAVPGETPDIVTDKGLKRLAESGIVGGVAGFAPGTLMGAFRHRTQDKVVPEVKGTTDILGQDGGFEYQNDTTNPFMSHETGFGDTQNINQYQARTPRNASGLIDLLDQEENPLSLNDLSGMNPEDRQLEMLQQSRLNPSAQDMLKQSFMANVAGAPGFPSDVTQGQAEQSAQVFENHAKQTEHSKLAGVLNNLAQAKQQAEIQAQEQAVTQSIMGAELLRQRLEQEEQAALQQQDTTTQNNYITEQQIQPQTDPEGLFGLQNTQPVEMPRNDFDPQLLTQMITQSESFVPEAQAALNRKAEMAAGVAEESKDHADPPDQVDPEGEKKRVLPAGSRIEWNDKRGNTLAGTITGVKGSRYEIERENPQPGQGKKTFLHTDYNIRELQPENYTEKEAIFSGVNTEVPETQNSNYDSVAKEVSYEPEQASIPDNPEESKERLTPKNEASSLLGAEYPKEEQAITLENEGLQSPVTETNNSQEKYAEKQKTLADHFADKFDSGHKYKTIVEARKEAGEYLGKAITAGSESVKDVDEAVETGVVKSARKTIERERQAGKNEKEVFDAVSDLYSRQPNLISRTSTSVSQQAYSTPAPIAFLASHLAGINSETSVYEPTAGNGMLLIDSAHDKVIANELNGKRADSLEYQGFQVTREDASSFIPETKTDVVIANPPFGRIKDDSGTSRSFDTGYYETHEIDHAIALKSLDNMKDDGRAVLILGGKRGSDATRSQKYHAKEQRQFYKALFDNYNVTDHFTVDGKLYEKQGAGYPIDVITIEGRGRTAGRKFPAAQLPRIYKTFDELRELINEKQRDPVSRREATEGKPVPGIGYVLDSRGEGIDGDDSPVQTGLAGNTERGDVSLPDGETSVMVDGVRGRNSKSYSKVYGGRAGTERPSGDRPEMVEDSGGESGGDKQSDKIVPDKREDISNGGDNTEQLSTENGKKEKASGRVTERVGGRLDKLDTLDNVERPLRKKGTLHQNEYIPKSSSGEMGTLIPKNMAFAVNNALDSIEDEHGNVDDFVADKLGYDRDDLKKYFGAEQVDAIALAVSNLENSKGFIIGDQTGIGKGRVNAAIIRYASKAGKIPVFVTMKPDLYADMIRDLSDIGVNGFKPLITNEKASIDLPDGRVLSTGSKHSGTISRVISDGNIDGYDAVFTTYDQINAVNGKDTQRRDLLLAIAPKAVFILDESHNAGGQEGTRYKKGAPLNRADFVRKMLQASPNGVFYSSATYAKRPDVMSLYFKTDMKYAVSDKETLSTAISNGGIPLQQVVAAMLAESGQYIRRERSFEGATVDTTISAIDKKIPEQVSGLMAAINGFNRIKEQLLEQMKEDLKGDGVAVSDNHSEASIESSNFTSVMHNLISQVMLAAKADAAVNEAVKALERGEKPIITVSNTMGSFISGYAAEKGIANGEAMDLNMRDLFMRYLEKTRMITEKDAGGEKSPSRKLTDEELGSDGLEAFDYAYDQIMKSDIGEIPVSPIDWIKHRLSEKQYSVGEITGRTAIIDYSGSEPVYATRKSTTAGNIKTVEGFNSGDLDALVINVSGSTGISLHSSEKFKDRRKRTMIIAQPELNIDVFMQMLGRVFRTGQVVPPAYQLLAIDTPAEKRPMAILGKKMASLNANTTASRTSAQSFDGVPDFLNRFGDAVVCQIMADNKELHSKLGEPLNLDGSVEEDAARKVTGRIPLLPVTEQEKLYSQIEADYAEAVKEAEAMGAGDLEARTLKLDAKLITSAEYTPAVKGAGKSPFAAASTIGQYDVKMTGKPHSSAKVTEMVTERLGISSESSDENIQSEGKKDANKIIDGIQKSSLEHFDKKTAEITDENRLALLKTRMNDDFIKIRTFISDYHVGSPVTIRTIDDYISDGIVVDMVKKGHTDNPLALSQWKITIAVTDATRQITVPLSRLYHSSGNTDVHKIGIEKSPVSFRKILDQMDKGQKESREKIWIATGNILAAFSELKKGRIVNFEDSDGRIQPGIILPKKVDVEKLLRDVDVPLHSSGNVLDFIDSTGSIAKTADKQLSVSLGKKTGKILLSVPASKAKGGKYFLNKAITDITGDFIKSGNTMSVFVSREQAADVISRIIDSGTGFIADSFRDAAKKITGAVISVSETEQSQEIKYSLSDSKNSGSGISSKQVTEALKPAEGMMAFEVVQKESELPDHVSEDIKAKGFSDRAEALFDPETNKIYFIADNIGSEKAAQTGFLENLFRHEGRHSVVPRMFESKGARNLFMDRAARLFKGDVGAYLQKNGMENTKENARIAAEEALVEQTVKGGVHGLVDEFLSKVMRWARKIFPNLSMTKVEARDFIRRADSMLKGDNLSRKEGFSVKFDGKGALDSAKYSVKDKKTVEGIKASYPKKGRLKPFGPVFLKKWYDIGLEHKQYVKNKLDEGYSWLSIIEDLYYNKGLDFGLDESTWARVSIFKAAVKDYPFETKEYKRLGSVPAQADGEFVGRSYNYMDQVHEDGVSVMDDEWLNSHRGMWMLAHKRKPVKVFGVQVGTGSDGEPVIIPVKNEDNPDIRYSLKDRPTTLKDIGLAAEYSDIKTLDENGGAVTGKKLVVSGNFRAKYDELMKVIGGKYRFEKKAGGKGVTARNVYEFKNPPETIENDIADIIRAHHGLEDMGLKPKFREGEKGNRLFINGENLHLLADSMRRIGGKFVKPTEPGKKPFIVFRDPDARKLFKIATAAKEFNDSMSRMMKLASDKAENALNLIVKPKDESAKATGKRIIEDIRSLFSKSDITLPSNNTDFVKGLHQFQTETDIAKNDADMKALYEINEKYNAIATQVTAQDREASQDYYDLGKDERKPVNKALLACDEERVKLTDGEVKERFGLSDKQIKGFRAIRSVLDNKLTQIVSDMVKHAFSDLYLDDDMAREVLARNIVDSDSRKNLVRLLKEHGVSDKQAENVSWLFDWINERKGYIPHKWDSEWLVRVNMPDGETYLLDVPTVTGNILPTKALREGAANKAAVRVIKERIGWSNEQIQEWMDNGNITLVKSKEPPLDLFHGASMHTMSAIIDSATERAWEEQKDAFSTEQLMKQADLKAAIRKEMEELFLAKGAGRHFIARKGVKGFREDIDNIMSEYIGGINSWMVKRDKAMEFSKAMGNIDPKNTPEKFKHARAFVDDMLGESQEASWFKKFAGIWFLGADVSAAALNAFQNFTHAAPLMMRLSGKEPVHVQLSKAMKDSFGEWKAAKKEGRAIFTGESKFISKEEGEIVRNLFEQGFFDPAVMGEQTGFHPSKIWNNYADKTTKALMYMFTGVEALNRSSAFIAAYRRAKAAGISDPVQTAKQIVIDAHYAGGKQNRPLIVRRMGAVGNIGYTFMMFPVNNLFFLKDMFKELFGALYSKDKARIATELKVAGSHLGALFTLGGLSAMPFASIMAPLVKGIFSDDDDDWEVALRKHLPPEFGRLIVRGLPAVLGNDMSGRVSSDVLGMPAGFGVMNTMYKRALKAGDYAVQGEYLDSVMAISPDFIRNPYNAIMGVTEGGEKRGRSPVKYTGFQAVMKGAGFSPTAETEAYAAKQSMDRVKEKRSSKLEDFAEELLQLQKKKDSISISNLRKRVSAYNELQKKDDDPVIKWSSVIKSARQRDRMRNKGYLDRVSKGMKNQKRAALAAVGAE